MNRIEKKHYFYSGNMVYLLLLKLKKFYILDEFTFGGLDNENHNALWRTKRRA